MPSGKRVAIVQSNYVPWRGYFDLIASVDEFVLLDDVQYTRRDWRNRNRIKTSQGTRWLTIPVQVSGRYTQSIAETNVAEEEWAAEHWTTVSQSYRHAAGFEEAAPFVQPLYASVPGPSLSEVNRHFLAAFCERLEIATPLTRSHDYGPEGTKTARLLDICRKAEATTYVSGPSAKDYLEEDAFAAHGIAVEWFEYGPYPEYEQVHPPFEPQVSILDTLLCTGAAAAEHVRPMRVA
jgi:WbqC-like protein family